MADGRRIHYYEWSPEEPDRRPQVAGETARRALEPREDSPDDV